MYSVYLWAKVQREIWEYRPMMRILILTGVKCWKLDSCGQTVRGLTDWSHHVILLEVRPRLGLLAGQDMVVGPVQSGPHQVRHGAVDDGEVVVSGDLGAEDPAQEDAGVGQQGPARLHQDLVLRLS